MDRDDYLLGINTGCAALRSTKGKFPGDCSVKALYTQGLVVIISTKRRFGGFAK